MHVAYTKEQNDAVFGKLKQLSYYVALDSINKKQQLNLFMRLTNLQLVHENDSLNAIDYKNQIKNNTEAYIILEGQKKDLKQALDMSNTETNKQKTYKWIAIIAGSAATTFVSYKYITK